MKINYSEVVFENMIYLCDRFNKDFKNNSEKFVLNYKKTKRGYLLYFDNKNFYYDIEMIASLPEKERNLNINLGRLSFYCLGEGFTKEDYYYLFLKVLKKLFQLQVDNKKTYIYTFPKMLNSLRNRLFNYLEKDGYKQVKLPV